MSAGCNVGELFERNEGSRILGGRIPTPQPLNCKNHCPYGYGRAFCFPCMKKILGQDVESSQEEDAPEKGKA